MSIVFLEPVVSPVCVCAFAHHLRLKTKCLLTRFYQMQRDICIQHALEATGISTKDPKVAVTDNFLCTGGRIEHRDHIACTGMFFLSHLYFINQDMSNSCEDW